LNQKLHSRTHQNTVQQSWSGYSFRDFNNIPSASKKIRYQLTSTWERNNIYPEKFCLPFLIHVAFMY
jgi:hypothetical protein